MIKNLFNSVIVLLALSIFGNAHAGVIFDPTNTGSSVNATKGLEICWDCSITTTLKDLDAQTAMLNVGDTVMFDFFDIKVGGKIGGSLFDIVATLAFTSPGGAASDSGNGGFGTIAGILSGGFLSWNGPVSVALENGTEYTVALEEGIALGLGDTATVGASVTLDRVGQVPEPGTLALLGLGLAGLGAARRRRA